MSKFMILFEGAACSCELYDHEGKHVYTLQEAIEIADSQWPNSNWVVYNGKESSSTSIF